MRFPFPDWVLVTPVDIYAEIVGENGVTDEKIFEGKCNYTQKTRTTLNQNQQVVTLTGKVVLKGDIYPNKTIRGYVEIGGEKRSIYRSSKPQNPDGSVFSTELELM